MRISHRTLLVIVAVVGLSAVAAMAALWPASIDLEDPDLSAQTTRLVEAVLVAVEEVPTDDRVGMLPGSVLVDVTARLEDTGEDVTFLMGDDTGDMFAVGQRVRLQAIEGADGQITYLVSDFRRERPMLLLAALFVLAVLAFGRWQGARALLGLGLTFLLIVGFIVRAILDGRDPVLVALVGSTVIMIGTLYLSHGFSRKTTAAVVGTACALIATAALAVMFVGLTSLTGFTSEEARLANLEVGGLSLRGLLLAGIIIGGLGVLDDVTMSQSSTVFELHRADPGASFADLLRGALTVGRDHIAATVNTLFLAYAGAALPLLILFVTGGDPIGTVITLEIVAVEVVRTLVGSIGLIAAVPLTTALAAGLVLADPEGARREARLGGHSHARAAPAARRRGGAHAERAARSARRAARASRTEAPVEDDPVDDDSDWIDRLRDAYDLPGDDRGPGSGTAGPDRWEPPPLPGPDR